MGHWGCLRYIYIASASDEGCEYGNQFYVRAFPAHLESLGDFHGCDFVIPS